MTITVVDFRNTWPEFADSALFTDALIQQYLDLGYKLHCIEMFDDCLDHVVSLYTAHYILLRANAIANSANGVNSIANSIAGQQNSRTVGSVSVGFDTQVSNLDDKGHWNLTTFGKDYIQFTEPFYGGGFQL